MNAVGDMGFSSRVDAALAAMGTRVDARGVRWPYSRTWLAAGEGPMHTAEATP